jgi:hypothetical protein
MRIRTASVIAALASSSQVVHPTGLAVKSPPPVVPAPRFTRTGFYVGVNAGIGGDRVDHRFLFAPAKPGNMNTTSFGGPAGG